MPTNCINGTLSPYQPSSTKPWNIQRVRHLYLRMGYDIKEADIQAALQLAPSTLVDQLIDSAIALPTSPLPSWGNWEISNYFYPNTQNIDFDLIFQHYDEWRRQWVGELAVNGFREKLALFWSNHFVTEFLVYSVTPALIQYHTLLQQHSLGNLKDFVHDIGLTPAMLYYLNGQDSTKYAPNENYARELYELFTLGQDIGYTQQDIVETSRALTGWRSYNTKTSFFDANNWDDTQKTIFGQTGLWDYDDVINILFAQRPNEIATHICREIYKHFVYAEPNDGIVQQLATTLINSNFELASVFRQLFKSEHFFEDETISTGIKTPYELMLGILNRFDFSPTFDNDFTSYLIWATSVVGQDLYNPPDVAGWKGDKVWLDTANITGRWRLSGWLLWGIYERDNDFFLNFVKNWVGANINDPDFITEELIHLLIPNGLHDIQAYHRATLVFKGSVPQNYYDNGSWNLNWDSARWQIMELLLHLIELPEFQLK